MKESFHLTVPFVAVTSIGFIIFFRLLGVSAMTLAFAEFEIGKLVGPVIGRWMAAAIIIIILILPTVKLLRVSARIDKSMTSKEVWGLVKRKKKKIGSMIFVGLLVSLLVIFSFSLIFIPRLAQADKTIAIFVAESRNESLQDYAANLTSFLNNNLKSSYNKPEAAFEIDNQISNAFIDSWIMQIWNVTRSDLILYQGWGSCGQAAILVQQLLHDCGYETRLAHFMGVDHEWAEVKHDRKWLIIDPWYIGNLVEIQALKNLKPDFQKASGVEVQYYDGTVSDASKDHGY